MTTLASGIGVLLPPNTPLYERLDNDSCVDVTGDGYQAALITELSAQDEWVKGLVGTRLVWFWPGNGPRMTRKTKDCRWH